MNDTSSEMSQVVDQFADMAHAVVDRLQERADKMEADMLNRSHEARDAMVSGIERRTKGIEEYIGSNPMMSAALAFGLGIAATQVFKSKDWASAFQAPAAEKDPVAEKAPAAAAKAKPAKKKAPAAKVTEAA
ncbi:MAG: hypothetical protein ACE5G3_03825 [Gammaproteobacteria bacterium]